MNKIPEVVAPDSSIQSRSSNLILLKELARDNDSDLETENKNHIPFESLPKRYQISAVVLWDCLLALKIKPQTRDGQIYFTDRNLKRLEQLIKRIEIAWACHHVLGTRYQVKREI